MGLLVGVQHDGGVGRVQVQPDDVPHLVDELRIGRQLEVLGEVGLEAEGRQMRLMANWFRRPRPGRGRSHSREQEGTGVRRKAQLRGHIDEKPQVWNTLCSAFGTQPAPCPGPPPVKLRVLPPGTGPDVGVMEIGPAIPQRRAGPPSIAAVSGKGRRQTGSEEHFCFCRR